MKRNAANVYETTWLSDGGSLSQRRTNDLLGIEEIQDLLARAAYGPDQYEWEAQWKKAS